MKEATRPRSTGQVKRNYERQEIDRATSMASVARSCLALLATFLLVFGLHGQETCSEEVKLLLSPTQLQACDSGISGSQGDPWPCLFLRHASS